MSEITQVFQSSCGKAIIDLASLRDMDVIIYSSFGSYTSPYGRNLLSEIGKKNIIHLPDYSSLDAIIALSNTFDIKGMDKEFFRLVREQAKCPVICLQTGEPDFYTVSIDNKKAMYEMTRHFIDVHQFNDICYMSGPFQYKDSPERLKGFVEAMRDAGLPINPNTIYEGNYWRNRGAKALDHFMQGRRTYPQAIICANDYMALSICEELERRGLRVPEDVCVSGFDGIKEGEDASPSLTTITVRPERYAEAAFMILDDIKTGKKIPRNTLLPNDIHYRASCGCGKQLVCGEIEEIYSKVTEQEFLLRESGRITADYQNTFDIDSSLSVATYYFYTLGCDTGYICFCNESDKAFTNENIAFTEEMILLQIMHAQDRRQADAVNEVFPRKDILPKAYWETDEPGVYIVLPVFFKNKDYGYLVLKPNKEQWPNSLLNTYISTLSTAIENCYYEKKFSAINEITKLSQTDELTGLFNRRGFENALMELLKNASDDVIISIASIDMDNLKKINDIHGHSDGDFALQEVSRVLSECLGDREFCARFGGDEFSAVLVSSRKGHTAQFTKQFTTLLEAASKASGKPYPLHASIGICDLNGRDTSHILDCMRNADDLMYESKRAYKSTLSKEERTSSDNN